MERSGSAETSGFREWNERNFRRKKTLDSALNPNGFPQNDG